MNDNLAAPLHKSATKSFKKMSDWVYGEEALFLKEEGITDPPCRNCPKCHQDSLYFKSIVLNSK